MPIDMSSFVYRTIGNNVLFLSKFYRNIKWIMKSGQYSIIGGITADQFAQYITTTHYCNYFIYFKGSLKKYNTISDYEKNINRFQSFYCAPFQFNLDCLNHKNAINHE